MTKDLVRHSFIGAPSQLELKDILSRATGIDKIIFILAGRYGLRAGEMEHFRSKWLHINDEKAKEKRIDFIEIPPFGDICECNTCLLQEWFNFQKNKEKRSKHDRKKIKKNFAWYKEQEQKFYELKTKGKLPKLPAHQWSPKSTSGARVIPLVFTEYTSFLKDFFSKNESVGISRISIWRRMKKFGVRTHQNRSTSISYFANNDMNPHSLKKFAGWKTIASCDPYISREEKAMIEEAKQIVKHHH